MQPNEFSKRRSGRLVKRARGYWAFVPSPLPPELELTWEVAGEVSLADRGVERVGGDRSDAAEFLSLRPTVDEP